LLKKLPDQEAFLILFCLRTGDIQMKKILIADDDTTFCLMLQTFLSKQNFEVAATGTVKQALNMLDRKSFDLVLSDYRLPDNNGIDLLNEIIKRKSGVRVIIMTSYGDIRLAVKAIKTGAFDYLTKPINPEELLGLVKNALEPAMANPRIQNMKDSGHKIQFVEGVSDSWNKLREQINLIGPTGLSVIIEGESGTGKEFVARKIHELSHRSSNPFIAIDCGSLSVELANSELFGHVKGAFTGAISDKQGQLELANGGTIFFDEIGNLSYDIQVKLLRAIQERTIRRTGGTKEIDIDVRIIAATNEDLQKIVVRGSFREDLFHRLNEFRIVVDNLRNRKEDIPVFSKVFLQQSNDELGKNITGFDEEAMEKLINYSWPGNLRELKNTIRKSVLVSNGNKITKNCLPSEIWVNIMIEKGAGKDTTNLKILSENIEKETILGTLQKVHYNKSKAARLLNIDRKTLYYKLKDYRIDF
jgi:two-component system response regulator HydG